MAAPVKLPEPELLRPFYWTVGAYQIMIAHRLSSVWATVTNGEYASRAEVGSPRERAVADAAVKLLNDSWVAEENRTFNEATLIAAYAKADAALPVASGQIAA